MTVSYHAAELPADGKDDVWEHAHTVVRDPVMATHQAASREIPSAGALLACGIEEGPVVSALWRHRVTG